VHVRLGQVGVLVPRVLQHRVVGEDQDGRAASRPQQRPLRPDLERLAWLEERVLFPRLPVVAGYDGVHLVNAQNAAVAKADKRTVRQSR